MTEIRPLKSEDGCLVCTFYTGHNFITDANCNSEYMALNIGDDEYTDIPLVYDRNSNAIVRVGDLSRFSRRKAAPPPSLKSNTRPAPSRNNSPASSYQDNLEDYAPLVFEYTPPRREMTLSPSPNGRFDNNRNVNEHTNQTRFYTREEVDDILNIKAERDRAKPVAERMDRAMMEQLKRNNSRHRTEAKVKYRSREEATTNTATTSSGRVNSSSNGERQDSRKRMAPQYIVEEEPVRKRLKSVSRR